MQQNIQQEARANLYQASNLQENSQKPTISKVFSKLSSSASIQIQQVRISEELIVIKDQGQKALVSSIICPICLLTLPLPYFECQECNNSFCPNCIEDWWNKNPDSNKKECVFNCQNASFKKVKRSNTYIALMDVLQFKCGLCLNLLPLSSYEKHNSIECPETEIQCTNEDCNLVVRRKDIDKHLSQCQFRLQNCQFCNQSLVFKDLQVHEQKLCTQRTVKCENNGCERLLKLQQIQVHLQNCDFKLIKCKWCDNQYRKSLIFEHQMTCQCRKMQCEWCKQIFKPSQFQQHLCDLKQQICRLCEKGILVSEMKQHRNDCMFQNMVKMKQQNLALIEENKKLHYKINELQEIIEDSVSNSEGKALQVMRKYKMKEKTQFQKDLERIHNSMNSIKKLRDQQINKHTQKIVHLFGYSLCLQCKALEKKFMDMKEPLLIKRRQIMQKIQQINKFQETAKGQ